MALRRTPVSCLIFGGHRAGSQLALTLGNLAFSDGAECGIHLHHEYHTSPDATAREVFRRFLQRRMLNNQPAQRPPDLISIPVGEKLREKLRGISIPVGDRLWLRGLSPLATPVVGGPIGELSVDDARKVLKLSLLLKLTARLRELPESSISYGELVRICSEACGGDGDKAVELARALDKSANIIILGDSVFLKPEQVAKSIEALMSQTIPKPNDPRRYQLERMERQKAEIDWRARAQVRAELCGGLGLVVAQTLAFMRLTFWELSWDVMEPICFFAASLHFAAAYAFFLCTSVEPSFQGYFEQRFRTKQRKLMAAHGFDLEMYNRLRRLFYPEPGSKYSPVGSFSRAVVCSE
ncbi:calcium uniporter protein 4, mitochondrial-like [Punica granatum]|uniref:Calcium uniporter protein 4, mitochondrial-like n=1 Tax=Punica granatum TaxID=22663 RepID=A0A218X7Y9_PUNGR|nr:calcium uniporter protein 4, mitochondrial-like [Punica granatum]OWM80819.1 hypothetical protein CDL15_Pgr006850 [Punica granatum]